METPNGAYRGDPSLSDAIRKMQDTQRQQRERTAPPDRLTALVKVADAPVESWPPGTAWLDTSVPAP